MNTPRTHARIGMLMIGLLGFWSVAEGKIVYVAKTGSDANDGLSWATAKVTVQAGLNAAVAGDEVWVAAGVYTERVTLNTEVGLYGGFSGGESDLGQRNWKTNTTILDGSRAGSVVTAPSGATATTRIDGFTIRNGTGTLSGSSRYGGGIYCVTSSPTIANNTITGNWGSFYGGGVYCMSSSPTITNNTITENNVSSSGGGIFCLASSPAIANNAITGNTATGGASLSYGGGIYCSGGSPTITNNTITGSLASYGGGVYCISSATMIANNTITGNQASSGGGGIWSRGSTTIAGNAINDNLAGNGGGVYCSGGTPTIDNNTIAGNVAFSSGGGVYCSSGSTTIANNTITANSASSGGAIYCSSSSPTIINTIVGFNSSGICASGSGMPSLRCNCVYRNGASNYSGVIDPEGADGNISVDPQLVAADYGEVHLKATSPCINAGDDSVVQLDWADMDGEPRIQGIHVDIGADEFNGVSLVFTPRIVRVSPSGNDNNDGSSWELAKRTVRAGIDALTSVDGGDVWVAAGTYTEWITLKRYVHMYGGFAGTETSRDQRDWVNHETTLDGNASDSVVSVPFGAEMSAVDGFTIRNGRAFSGGGVHCGSSSPLIANNTITGNNAIAGGYPTGGGGIYSSGGSPVISNNVITGNSASLVSSQAGGGGGIYCSGGSPTISRNTITGNSITAGGYQVGGGGIYCSDGSPTILNNRIMGNIAARSGSYNDGGGIYCNSCSPTIANNTIRGNSGASGGGIYCRASSSTISNNTITGNAAQYGGGIYCSLSSPTVVNTIVAFNSSGIDGAGSGAHNFRSNCVYGNAFYNYSNMNDPTGTNGNISVDPQLLAVDYNEVHLKTNSPCVDAGDDAVVQSGWVDMDGEPRIQGTRVDIGTDEFNGTLPSFRPRVVRVSPSGNDNNDGSSWELAKRTVQAGINTTASAGGGDVWVAAGTYTERVTLTFFFHVYGGFAGTEASRDQRDWITNMTILDGDAGGSVVSIGLGSNLSTVDGFTIRNGKATSFGGGIYCTDGSPTLSNNTITGNTAPFGGGIWCSGGSPTIANNVIRGNSAGSGGGISCYSSSRPTISNNTIIGNAASYKGGGVSCDSASPTITNTIVAFNTSGIYRYSSAHVPNLRHNCVYGNTTYNYSDGTGPTGTDGNISVAPSFVRAPSAGADGQWATVDDDLGDLHLRAGSPSIDAGDNAAVPAGVLTDLDGLVRFFDDPTTPDGGLGTAPIVDMGAYEYIPGDFDHDADIDADDMKTFAACVYGPAVPYSGDCAGADFDRDGDVDQSDFGLLQRWFGGAGK